MLLSNFYCNLHCKTLCIICPFFSGGGVALLKYDLFIVSTIDISSVMAGEVNVNSCYLTNSYRAPNQV